MNWYNRYSKKRTFKFLIKSDLPSYARIEVRRIDGIFFSFASVNYSAHFNNIEIVILHYIDVWGNYKKKFPFSNLYPLHGDLSLSGNVLFKKGSVIFIDWEHFHINKAPLGFDALMFIYECLWFEYQDRKVFSNAVLTHSKVMIQKLIEKKLLSNLFFSKPLSKLIEFISDNSHLWGFQTQKIPILSFNESQIYFFDVLHSSIVNSDL